MYYSICYNLYSRATELVEKGDVDAAMPLYNQVSRYCMNMFASSRNLHNTILYTPLKLCFGIVIIWIALYHIM